MLRLYLKFVSGEHHDASENKLQSSDTNLYTGDMVFSSCSLSNLEVLTVPVYEQLAEFQTGLVKLALQSGYLQSPEVLKHSVYNRFLSVQALSN